MAWQRATAQTIAVTFYSDGVPTAPTDALTATISKDGASFAAIGGSVAQVDATPCALLELDADDTDCDSGVVKIAGGSVDDRYVEFVTEEAYTAARAAAMDDIDAAVSSRAPAAEYDMEMGRIDVAVSTRSSHTAAAVATAVWNTLTSALTTASSVGKLIVDYLDAAISSRSSHDADDVWTSVDRQLTAFDFTVETEVTSTDIDNIADAVADLTRFSILINDRTISVTSATGVVDSKANLTLVRDDDYVLQFTWEDQNITDNDIYLTVRAGPNENSSDDTDAVFQVQATVTDGAAGEFEVAIGRTETNQCALGQKYYYDIQAIDATGGITTPFKARLTVEGDITRRTSSTNGGAQ
jgi:hypothetical protein